MEKFPAPVEKDNTCFVKEENWDRMPQWDIMERIRIEICAQTLTINLLTPLHGDCFNGR